MSQSLRGAWLALCMWCLSIGMLCAQAPTLTNGTPTEGFIGEQVCFPVTFQNTGTPGYGPYIRLVLPPGFTFDNATFSSGAQIVQNLGLIPAAPNNYVLDPIAVSNTGAVLTDTIYGTPNSTVVLLQYPVGSLVQGGINLISTVCVTVDPLATLNVPVNICTQGMYQYGDTPTGTNGEIAGADVCQAITPILFRFDKQVNGSDGIYEEVPGGGTTPCHVHPYQLNVDIAAAGTLNPPVTITDVLPGELIYLGNLSLPVGCTAVEPAIGSLGGTLSITCTGTYPGSTANIDMQATFDAAVSDTLDETICDVRDINNSATMNAMGDTRTDSVITRVEHLNLTHSNNAGVPVTIGQSVLYSINADITEYSVGLDSALITFVVPDGMVFTPGSITWGGAAVAAADITVVPGPGSGSTVTVDVFAANADTIAPCANPVLQYSAVVNQTYVLTGSPVLSRDLLSHTSSIAYSLVESALICGDSSSSDVQVVDIMFQKTVNNSPPTGPGQSGLWEPGDTVQYLLELQVPSLDLNDVVITDFFPLPIHSVADLSPAFGVDVVFAPTTCWQNPPVAYTRDIATNSLILDFGDLSGGPTDTCIDIALLVNIPITTEPFADGLFHSNFMQVNSNNTILDNITVSELTLIQVGAPDLEITKGIASSNNGNTTISPVVLPIDGDATDADASDSLFFNITVANTGSASAYDVEIRDVIPPELTNCTLFGPTPVMFSDSTAIAFTGGFAGNALSIQLAAPQDSIGFSSITTNNHTVIVSYVCEVISNVQSGAQFDNTAEVDWAATRSGTKFPAIEDQSQTTITSASMNKSVHYIYPDYNGSGSRASIGEVVAYELELYIPEGTMNGVRLRDQLDEGLAFIGVDSIVTSNSSGASNLSTSIGGGFAGVQAGAVISNLGTNPQQIDRVLELDFGTVSNSDVDNLQDTIKIYYRTIVINHPTNTDGQQVRNRATLRWDDPNTPGDSLRITDRASFVTIVEPELIVTKTFVPNEVLPGNNSFVTISVQNPVTSSAPAFDVSLTDLLPVEMTFVSGFASGGTANITTAPNHAGGAITAHWDTINVGEIYSMTFEVQSSSSVVPCTTLINCANIVWESIAEVHEPTMPTAFSSPLGIKRTGNVGAIGGTANTYIRDSCVNLDVIIDNTFDPFITGNTPVCEGERVVLNVQQYNGNVVSYNWFGPGVPAGFNNYELIIDPVTVSDTGTYYVIVELDGCTTDTSNFFQLELRPKPSTPNVSPSDTTVCEGSSVQFSTDTIAASYTWTGPNGFTSNSSTTQLISPVALADAGIYTLFTTNAQGCNSDPVLVNLMVTPRPVQPSLANNTPVCSGQDLVLSSSTAATSYRWIAPNGQDTVTATNILTISSSSPLYVSGNWTLVITNANGCESVASLTSEVIVNTTPTTPVTFNSGPICEGQDVTLTVNSVAGATYSWYTDAALTNLIASSQNPTISGLLAANSPDTFYVQINTNSCLSDTGLTIVTINSNPTAFTPTYTPLCSGDTIFLFANAAAATYSWTGPNGFISNVQNPVIDNAAAVNAGSYSVSVTDANGCSNLGIVQVAVEERPITPSITSNGPICEGATIQLDIASYTGTSVVYTWNTPIGTVTTGVPSLTVNNATPVNGGIYSVSVNVDGCVSLADSLNVIVNSNPTAPNVPANFTVCEGDTILLTTTTVANIYMWTGPNGFSSNLANPIGITPATASDAGVYSLTIQDLNGCTSPASNVTVAVNLSPTTPALTATNSICQGDNIVLTTMAIATSYQWIAPNGADTTTAAGTVTIGSGSGLYQSGNWTLVVTDGNGCSSSASLPSSVVINTVPVTASPSNNGPICEGATINLMAGTVSGATYAWYSDAGATNQISTLQNPVITNVTGTTTYYLVVTVNGCIAAVDSTTATVLPAPATPAIPATQVVCEGGTITLSTSTVASSYNWTGPNGFSSTLQNPAVINNATSANAGVYTLSVANAIGCTSADTNMVVTINPSPATPALTATNSICQGDDIVLTTTATATSYQWIAPNGADTTTAAGTVTIGSGSGLYQSGNWTLVVTDGNGCSSSSSLPSSVVINTVPVTASPSNNGPICEGGTINLMAGTVSGATYAWYSDVGATNQISTLQNPVITNVTGTTTYYLVVTVNGCSAAVDSTTATVLPAPVTPAIPATQVVCEGGMITLSTSTVASSYNWTGPNGFSSTLQNPAVINNATSANAGVYTLSIANAIGCTSADTNMVVTINPSPATPALTATNAICQGDDIVLNTTAAATSYQWIAPNGADTTTAAGTVTIDSSSGLYQSGNWTLVVTDGNGCSSSSSLPSSVVINTVPVTASPSNNGPICEGATVNLMAGTVSGASYAWYSDAGATNQISTLQNPIITNVTGTTTYYLVVTVNGCVAAVDSTTATVLPAPATPSIPATQVVCEGGTITLSTSTIASSYNWIGPNGFSSTQQNPAVINNATSANAGVYTLSIANAIGCISADTNMVVTVNSSPATPALTATNAICQGDDIVLNTTAAATSYQWIAPNGADTTTAAGTVTIGSSSGLYQSGNWTLVVTDANGCSSSASLPAVVSINTIPTPTAFNNGPVCIGDAVMLSTALMNGAIYAWYSDAGLTNLIATQTNPTVNNIITDSTFYLVVTINGCASAPVTTTVTTFPVPATPALPVNFAVCEGEDIILSTLTVAANYNWTGPNGFVSNLQNPPAISPATTADAGVYTLSIVDANGCLSGDTSITVTVNTAPTAPILTNNSALCAGDTLILTTTANADTFRWIAPNGLDTITTTDSLIILPTDIAYYQSGDWMLITQLGNNCPSLPSAVSSVVINSTTAAPTVSNNGPVCVGGTAIISTPGASGATYQWYSDIGLSNLIATTASVTVTNITTDSTFYLVVTVNGCVSPSGSTTVNVIGQPTAPIVPADFAICTGGDIVLTTSTVASSYNWTGPNGFASTQQNPPVITNSTPLDSGDYHLVVTLANGCVAAQATVHVSVHDNPPVPIITANGPLCFGDTLTLTSSASCGQSQWIGPNGNSAGTLGIPGGGNVLWTLGSTTNIPAGNANYLSGGWSMICIDTLTGCTAESAPINVAINAVPTQPAIFNNGPVCIGDNAQLSTATISGATYAWYSDAGLTNLVSTQQNPLITNVQNDTTWYLVVTVNGCSSPVSSTIVTVHPAPAPPNVPANFAVCEGESIVLSTTTVASGYSWTGPNGFTSNLQNPIVISNATVADAGVYNLSIIDGNGCGSSTASVTVTVNSNPSQPVLSTNSAICMGDSLMLNTTATATNYQWIAPNGADTITTTASLSLGMGDSLYQAGSWSLVVSNASNCSSIPSAASMVVINNIPAQPAIFNNGPVCIGDAAQLSTATVIGATYAWYDDAALTNVVSTQQNPLVTNIQSDTTWYLVVTVNGCSSVAGSTNIMVHPAPATPNVPVNFAVCEGENIVLSTTTVASGYSWTGPNGFTSNLQNPIVISNATAADAGVYNLFIIDGNGCGSATASVTVTVNSNPSQPVLSTNSAICMGDSIMLNTTATATNYQWIAPNGADTITTTASLSLGMGNGFYQAGPWSLVVSNASNCSSIPSAASMIVINNIPAQPTIFNNGPVCIGDAAQLSTATVTGATYAWYDDAALTNVVSTQQNPLVTNIQSDTTWHLVVTVNGCSSAAGSTNIMVHPAPTTPTVPANFAVCEGESIVLSTTTVASGYSWMGPNGFTSNLQNPIVISNATAADAGVYNLSIIDGNGCGSSTASVTVTVNSNPSQPVLSTNSAICMGDSLMLSTTATATNYQWIAPNGADTITTAASLSLGMGNNLYQAGSWSLVVSNASNCSSVPSAVSMVVINNIPAQPAIFNNGPVCIGDAVQLNTATVTGATYAWYGDAGLTNLVLTQQNPIVTNIQNDTTWYLVITVNGCSSAAGSTNIMVHPVPAIPNVPTNFAVCEGESIVLSTTTVASAYSWTGPNGFASNLQNPLVINNATAVDAGVYSLSIIDGNGCGSATASVTVTVNSNPPTPIITANSPLCFGDTLTLTSSGNCGQSQWIGPHGNSAGTLGTPGGGNVLWTIGSTTNIDAADANYLSGSWYMVCIDTLTGCMSESNTINVEINPIPVVNAFNNGAICAGEDGNLSATVINGGTYAWYSDATLTTLISTTNNVTIPNLQTTTTYYVVATVNGCASLPDSTTIVVHPNPVVPTPTHDPLCQLDTLFLHANGVGAIASYWWTGPNGFTSNLSDPVIPNANALNAGSYVVTVTDSMGCQAVATIEVTLYPKPQTPTISHNAPFCEGTNNLTLATQAYFGTDVRYIWTLPNGTQDTTLVPSLMVNNATVSDTGLYALVVFVDGCISLPAQAVISIYPTPATPNMPANFAVCEGDTIVLTTTTVASGYNWTGPNGFISNLQSPAVVNATAVDSGIYTLNVTNVWGCRSADTSVHITINANPPSATIVSNSPLCFGDTLHLTSSDNCGQAQWIGPNGNSAGTLGTPGGGNVLWTLGSTTNIPATNANYLSGNWYMVCIDTITGCQSISNTITVDITPIPATPAAFNNSPVCVGSSVQLTTTTITGALYSWYADSTMMTLVATSQNPVINNITSDTTFYIAVTLNGCTSLLGSTFVTVHPVPATPNVPADFAVCEGDNIVLTTTTLAAGYQWTGPNGFTSNLQNPLVLAATLVDSGTYNLQVIDANGCLSGIASVQVTVNPNPTMPVLSSNTAICNGTALVLSTTSSVATYQWIAPNGADTVTTIDSLVIAAGDPLYQAGGWTLVVSNATGCASPVSNIEQVVIHAIPATQIVFNNGPVCSGTSVNLFTSLINGASYEWYADAALTNLVATSQNPTIQNITTDSTFYLVITVNGCASLAGSTTVLVHPQPATPNVPANMVVCEQEAIVLTTTTNAAAYVWTGPNGFTSNLQSPTAIASASVLDSGTYTLFVVDANGCSSDDTTVHVMVNPLPAIPTVIANNTPVCEGDTIILMANAGAVGTTYEWFDLTTNISLGTGQTLTIPNATIANAGNYYVVATLNGCASPASKPTVVQVNQVPVASAYAGIDINLCNTANLSLDATLPSGATGIWTTTSGATIANPTSINTAVFNLGAGASVFYWTLSNGACANFSVDSVLVDMTLSSNDIAQAGLDQSLCGQTTATLNAAVPAASTGVWTQSTTQASQGVVITNPTNPNSTVTGLQQGSSYNFTWTLSNGNCADYSSDLVNITIDVAPPDLAYAGQNIMLCNQTTINLDALNSQYGTGVWTALSGGTLIDPTLDNTLVVNLPQDTSYYVWTLSNGTCMNYSSDTVMVVVSTTNNTADAGLNQVVCGPTPINLAAIAPPVGTGMWSQTAAQAAQGVVIVDPADPNSQVLGLTSGTTFSFTWTLSNGTCLDYDSDVATITVNSAPPDNAFAGNDINICGTTNTLNLTASTPTIATGIWTTTSGATISNPTQPNSTVGGLSIGTNVFVWTLSAGTCVDYDNDTLVIILTPPSTDVANAGLDSAYCAQGTITLDATAPTVGSGYWSQTPSQASLGAVITNPADTATTVTGLMPGVTYTFSWTLTNGGCVDYSNDQTLITIDALPTNVAYAGEDTILCGGNSIQLDASMPALGTGFWTTNDTATIVTPNTSNSLVVNIDEDTTTYYWTLTNGACVDYSMDSITVIISPVSTDLAFAGFDQVLCGVDSITLSANVPTTSTGVWSQPVGQASQGVMIADPTNPSSTVTGLQPGQAYTFSWTLSTTGCLDFSSDAVTYTINAIPQEVAYAGTDIIVCDGNTVNLAANMPVFSTGAWSTNSTAIIINPTVNTSNVVNLPTDTVEFYWSLSNGSCNDYSIDTMVVIVTPTFSVDTAYAGLDIEICNSGTAQLTALVPTTATGNWTQPFNQSSNGVVITNINDPNSTVTGLQLDSSYTFVWNLSNGPCIGYDSDEVLVRVSALPSDAAYAGQDVVICGISEATISATAPSAGTGMWSTPSSSTIVTPTSPITEVLNLTQGANQFIWTLSNGACRDYSADTVVVTVDAAPIANSDSFAIVYNSSTNTIDVTPNDSLNSNWVISVTQPMTSGLLNNLGNGEFEVTLQDVLVDQSFIYQLCNPNCPDLYCDTALVVLDVQGGTDCVFPNTVTPNNDGTNDYFIVPCLDGLMGTKLLIFNRWGDQIYENDNYTNNWDATHDGAPVPDATYFYIMELADGTKYQGFIEVRR